MLSALFAAECPMSLVRELRDADPRSMPARLWKSLADAGVFGLLLPQEYGGAGGALSDLGIFCLEAGRGLCPTIVHGTVQAALAIQLLGGPDQHAAWLPSLADGNISATTCLWGPRNAAVTTPTLRVRSEAWGGWRLSGAVDFVADADLADHLVVSATASGERVMAFVVPLTAAGLWIDPLRLMGGHRTFRIGFDDVEVIDPAAVLDGADGAGLAEHDLRRLANAAVALLSLDLVGVGEAVLQRTVDYTMARQAVRPPDRVLSGRTASGGEYAYRAGRGAARRPFGGVLDRAGPHRHPSDRDCPHARGDRGETDHARCAPIARRHGLCGRDRPAFVLRAGPSPVHAGRRGRRGRNMAGGEA